MTLTNTWPYNTQQSVCISLHRHTYTGHLTPSPLTYTPPHTSHGTEEYVCHHTVVDIRTYS